MARIHAFEFEDQQWFPGLLREAMTGFLTIAGRIAGHGKAMAPTLAAILERQGETRIVDLCSGSGGPLRQALDALRDEGVEASVTYTDLYPGARYASASDDPRVHFEPEPVAATDVPSRLGGVRTLVNGFHHFRPEEARSILCDAAEDGAPIAIFEFVGRHPALLLSVLFAPINTLLIVPFIRPFHAAWIPLTYLVPLIPLLVLWDGLVSCLRVYDEDELLALCDGIADPQRYAFRIEAFRVAPLPLTFRALVGEPVVEAGERAQAVGATS